MPLIDYECINCHHIDEQLVKNVDEAPSHIDCPECGFPAQRQEFYASTSFVLKGQWFKQGY